MKTILDEKTKEYLIEALIRNSEIPLEKSKIDRVLSDLKYDPNSKRSRFKLDDTELELDPQHKDNYQDVNEEGLNATLILQRIIKNQELTYFMNTRGPLRKLQEESYKRGLMFFEPSAVSRFVREDPSTKPLILKSAEQGYQWSLLGLYVKTYFSEKKDLSLTIRRPIIAIPGITEKEDLETLRKFEDNYQKPSTKNVLAWVNRYKI
jgi:hypothetical protein